jgi:cobalt-zinc-cadmium efflux system outer membrane protein
MNRLLRRTWLACLVGSLLLSSRPASALEEAATVLPPAASVIATLSRSPAYRAALRGIEAERSVHRQYRVGAYEWTGTVSAARRAQSAPTPQTTSEWDVGIERRVRLPGKAAVADRAGQARVGQAEAVRHKVWREQARLLLDRQGFWLRERESARVWGIQVGLLRMQADAVTKRHRVGDAARIDQQQAEAALALSQSQAEAASGRAMAAREALDRLFPGLDMAVDLAMPDPQALLRSDAEWLQSQLAVSPELELARRESDAADALMRLELAETRADPTLGVRVGQARSGAERTLGLVLNIPFGGEYRDAGASAAAARAAAAGLQRDDAERRALADASSRLREAKAAHDHWLRSADVARRLAQVAASMAKGYQLGDGSLAEVLSARRLANEQELSASTGAVDAWISRYRLELEAGLLWSEPGTPR